MSSPSGPPYTPAVRSGEWLVISGQVGITSDGVLVTGGFEDELVQALENLRSRLTENAAALTDLVKTTVFLRHLSTDYGRMNEIYSGVFPEPRPARSAVGVAELPMGAMVEIEAWARIAD